MQKLPERSKRFPTIIMAADFAKIALIKPEKHLLSDSPLVPATPPRACVLINQKVRFKKMHLFASEEDALLKEFKVALLGWLKVRWLPA